MSKVIKVISILFRKFGFQDVRKSTDSFRNTSNALLASGGLLPTDRDCKSRDNGPQNLDSLYPSNALKKHCEDSNSDSAADSTASIQED
ncbi:MAG: hypothetical protein AAFN08_00225 [Cyanobacteria bacterium J06559_3]